MRKKLYRWQEECLDIWRRNRCRGIVNVTTGAGKTMLALAAISFLEKNDENTCGGSEIRYKIVVPKVFLVNQWKNALIDELGIPDEQIGFYYGARKDKPDRKFMIYVINSARYSISRQILADYRSGYSVFLIADECHHYGSTENVKIFDFLPLIDVKKLNYYSLGLSATPETSADGKLLINELGDEIYRFSVSDALESDIICDFTIFNIQLNFSADERFEYEDLTDKISKLRAQIIELYPFLQNLSKELFFSCLRSITANSDNPEVTDIIEAFLSLSFKRTELTHFAVSKRSCARELVKTLRSDSRIIIFGERIDIAEGIYEDLIRLFPGEVGRYHSLMSNPEKRNALFRYYNSEIRILVSCRALDEGLNVPETDVGIVVSSTQTDRQRRQRLGRILRRKGVGRAASLYYLYILDSYEYREFLNLSSGDAERVNTYNLSFDEYSLTFSFPEYENYSSKALDRLSKETKDAMVISEFMKNIEKGMVNSDFLLTEGNCMARVKSATTTEERNYFITMLYIIRELRRANARNPFIT